MATSKVAASAFPAQAVGFGLSASETFQPLRLATAVETQPSVSLSLLENPNLASPDCGPPKTSDLEAFMKSRKAKIRPGASGACEATLYEFRGDAGPFTSREEPSVARVAAADIHEALAYMRRWRPEFEIRAVQHIGLITVVSGSPLD